MESLPSGDVEQRAAVRPTGAQPQYRQPTDRAVGHGEHADADVRRPRRAHEPRRPARRPRCTHGAPATGGRPGQRAPCRARLQHHLSHHRRRCVHHRRVRQRPTQRRYLACGPVHRQGPRRCALGALQPGGARTETGVMLHEGKMFGWVNQLIVLLICLMILLSAVSGVVIWWKRRPAGGLGVPPLRHDLPKWKTAMVIMLGLAIIFPLVGASLIVVWVLDRLVLSRLFAQRESVSGST
ncbi:PepSY domain-containing protein [Pseudomonas allii]|uniref:PepSY domain-containing protein n=1 Tax=Pseudomonas allii TaxID=2740531 RepID=UPI0031342E8D